MHLGRKTSWNAESWERRADFNAWVQTCLELAKVQGDVQRVQSHIIDLTTTLSEADFNAAIDAFNTSLDEAGDDFCKITAATNTLTVSGAATPEQAKALYQAFADVLNKVADHLPVDSGADSATLKSAAEKIMSDAEADGYDPATISGGSPEAFNDPEIAKSMAAVGEAITKNCQ